MKRLSVRLLCMLTAVALLGECRARADLFDYTWTVNSGNSPANVFSNPPLYSGSVQISTSSGLQQQFTISTQANPDPGVTIPVATVYTSGGGANYGTGAGATPFSLSLVLTDTDSNKTSPPLVFAGTLSGTLETDPDQTTLAINLPATMESVTLGNNTYQVTIDTPVVHPGIPPGSPLISASVVVVPAQPTPTSNTPEPSSLVLAASAMLGLAARRWKRSVRKEA